MRKLNISEISSLQGRIKMKHTILIMGLLWGDEGKGKIVHAMARATGCDLMVRFNGGANAGHTVEADGQKCVFNQLPSGCMIPGMRSILANGSVIDLTKLFVEASKYEINLMISADAHVLTSEHIRRDALQEQSRGIKIGTTLSGNGPVHADKAARSGLRISQLYDSSNLTEAYRAARVALDSLRIQLVTSQTYIRHCKEHEGGVMILEGAHGWELDIDHGNYPYVTSSSCGIGGMAIGTGLDPRSVDCVLGVLKAYSTRVGAGTFPDIMSSNTRGAIQQNHAEVGTVTKRERRIDWLNLDMVRAACQANGVDRIALTHLDALSGIDEIQYIFNGDIRILPGWSEDLQGCTEYEDLPQAAREYVEIIERRLRVQVSMISVGPDEEQLIWRNDYEL